MKQKNTIRFTTIILTIIILIGTTGCSGLLRGRGDSMDTYNFRTGTKGLSMEFVDEMPPEKMFVGTEFAIGVKIKNQGAYDINDGTLEIIPIDRTAFYFDEGETQNFELTGKSLYIQEGEEDVITFPAKAICFRGYDGTRESAIKYTETKIKAQACYLYETEANFDLCIDTQHHQRRPGEEVACTMQDVTSSGQGGPVGVTKVEVQPPIPKGDKVTLNLPITMKKVGGSDTTIFSSHTNNCKDFEEQNAIDYEVTLGTTPMECEPNPIELKASISEANILCKAELDSMLGAYKSPLSVKAFYRVGDHILTDVKVDSPPGDAEINCEGLSGE